MPDFENTRRLMDQSSPAGSPPSPDFMPSRAEVLRYFSGTLRLMTGHKDGLDRLDLSADGFWRSFAALIVALPPAALSWLEYERVERISYAPGPLKTLGAHALADLTAWILPVLIMMMAARHIGFARKIVPFVVATNWGGAFLTWAFSPFFLLQMLVGPSPAIQILGLLVAFASIALTVRLVANATSSDIPLSVAIVTMMVMASLISYSAAADLIGAPIG